MTGSRFDRTPDGRLRLTLPEAERRLLVAIAAATRVVVAKEPAGHPVIERLFPRAYLDPTEDDAEGEWQSMVHPELRAGRLHALDVLLGLLDRATARGPAMSVVVDDEEAEHLLGALNGIRLALSAQLVPTDERVHDHESPEWLDELEADLVGELSDVP